MTGRAVRSRLALVGLAAVVLLLPRAGASAAEDDDFFNKTEALEVVAQAEADAGLQAQYKGCPGDVFRSKVPFWNFLNSAERVDESVCAKNPQKCYRNCLRWRDAEYCFRLGSTFQHHSLDLDPVHAQPFFAMACAAGEPGGCTNRAAGIRNGGYETEPWKDTPLAEKQACEFRSFAIACDNRDAWGCTMVGQAYRNGEGTAKDVDKAKASFDKSCEISPEFAACDYAKELRDEKPDDSPDE